MSVLVIGSNGYIGSALHRIQNFNGSIDLLTFKQWKYTPWPVAGYDTIVLLAGHSSMQMGRDDPDGAWQNNVVNFKNLLDKLQDNQRLIYMSSASVYNGIKAHPDENCVEFKPLNMYDLSKYIIDQLAIQSGKHTYGLRLCTVNGFSPVLRVDLMMNKMMQDAKTKGVVTIKNAKLERPILGMRDLVNAIKTIITSGEDNRGIYNLNSLTGYTVGDYARAVVDRFGGSIEDLGEEPHYVYGADTTKFQQTYNFKFTETIDSILQSLEQKPREKVIRAFK